MLLAERIELRRTHEEEPARLPGTAARRAGAIDGQWRTTLKWKDVPVPERMEHLPRDRRGYPIPWNVMRDNAGEPLFTVNDDRMAWKALEELLCPICGGALEIGDLWWVGGPLSAFHPDGAYFDSPMHKECSSYALQVCPHLAAPKYTKRLDGIPGLKNGVPFDVAVDPTIMPDRPVVFVQGRSYSYSITWPKTANRRLLPVSDFRFDETGRMQVKRWMDYEVWRFGEILEEEEGIALIRQALEEVSNQRTQKPKLIVPDTGIIMP